MNGGPWTVDFHLRQDQLLKSLCVFQALGFPGCFGPLADPVFPVAPLPDLALVKPEGFQLTIDGGSDIHMKIRLIGGEEEGPADPAGLQALADLLRKI